MHQRHQIADLADRESSKAPARHAGEARLDSCLDLCRHLQFGDLIAGRKRAEERGAAPKTFLLVLCAQAVQ